MSIIDYENFILAKKILAAYNKNDYHQVLIEGRRGIGKTTYAFKVLRNIYMLLGYDKTKAGEKAYKRIVFKLDDVLDILTRDTFLKMKKGSNDNIGIIWDDAGVHANNLLYFIEKDKVMMLQSLMDTIRGAEHTILLTLPNRSELLKVLREYDQYIVRICYDIKTGGNNRIAKGYTFTTLPSGMKQINNSFWDYYLCYMPVKIYEAYCKKRNYYTLYSLNKLVKYMEKEWTGNKKGYKLIKNRLEERIKEIEEGYNKEKILIYNEDEYGDEEVAEIDNKTINNIVKVDHG